MSESEYEVHEQPGPILLLAGPGTGKTTRLARRVKFLVEDQHVRPEQVTVITFSTAASEEMRVRISDPSNAQTYVSRELRPRICTMHSLSHSIVRQGAEKLGLPDRPSVVTDDTVRDLALGDGAQLTGLARSMASTVADCRQNGDCRENQSSQCQACNFYRRILTACGSVDHDEQLLLACRILRDDPEVLAAFRSQAHHLLVDEYQDINAAQHELICTLSQEDREGLFVVGDDDQSIYSWRGGSPEYIRGFEEDFECPGATRSLTECHRSAEHIHVLGASCAYCLRKSGQISTGGLCSGFGRR